MANTVYMYLIIRHIIYAYMYLCALLNFTVQFDSCLSNYLFYVMFIAELPTVANLNLATFTTNSTVLTFGRSISGDCVDNYTITTNASVSSSSISDTTVTISRPPSDPGEATYFVCVSAVDFAERTGPSSCLDCFRFTSKSAKPLNHLAVSE